MIYNGMIDADNCHSLVSNDVSYISVPIAPSGLHTDNFTFSFLERGSSSHRAFPDTVQYNQRNEKNIYMYATDNARTCVPKFRIIKDCALHN